MKIPEENFNASGHNKIWINNEKVFDEIKVEWSKSRSKVIEMKTKF